MRKLFKLFGKLFKFALILVIIAIVAVVAIGVFAGKDNKTEIKQNEPIVEKQEETVKKEDEIQDAVEVEQEPEVEVQEEEPQKEVIDDNTIRPEFQKSMESYEVFFDEYIEFMEAFKQDSSSLSMITKYAEFLAKYEKAMSEMDKIDESELTKAEDKLFLETQLRINNKLTQAAINY